MARIVTCTAPINIAVIKYWGKRDKSLILPLNDSISFTLSQDEMCAKTTIIISPKFTQDRFWLNHQEEAVDSNPRIMNCLKEVRRRASKRKHGIEDASFISWNVHIYSVNNFPTAAGLASSAAGYACLVYALGQIFELNANLSSVARLGSGSACRSLFGGMVQWLKGEADDGSDSYAQQIVEFDHWGDLHVIICVASDGKKKVSSTEGMERSVATSPFMKHRVNAIDERIELLLKTVKSKDWSTFCDITIKDSNDMHAVCLSTFPPCVYMNDTSHSVASLIHQYNDFKKALKKMEEKVCYTFDAGPNACIFVPGIIFTEFASLLNECFNQHASNNNPSTEYWKGFPSKIIPPLSIFKELIEGNKQQSHSLKYLIHTKIGQGPRDNSSHMLDITTGLPKCDNNLNCSRSSVIRSGHTSSPSTVHENPPAVP